MCLIDKDLVSIKTERWMGPTSFTLFDFSSIPSNINVSWLNISSFSLIVFFLEMLYMVSFYVSYVPRINGQLFPSLTTTKKLINTFTIMMQVEKEL